ncbi:MAG: hypothetical protein ABJC26_07790 [Gemmatimonadaceae bacterium]
MRRSSVAAASEQLRTFVSTLVDTQNRNVSARYNALILLSRNDSVIRALNAKTVAADTIYARTFLERHRNVADTSAFVSQLLVDADASPIVALGKPPSELEKVELDRVVAQISVNDTARSSEIFPSKNEIHFWAVTPARSNAKTVGFIAEQRRIRLTPLIEKQLKDFTGRDIAMYFASPGSQSWISLSGKQVAAKFDIRALSDSFRIKTNDGIAILGLKRSITLTPWFMVAAVPEASVFQRSYVFLRSILVVGVLLLAVSAFLVRVGLAATSQLRSIRLQSQRKTSRAATSHAANAYKRMMKLDN